MVVGTISRALRDSERSSTIRWRWRLHRRHSLVRGVPPTRILRPRLIVGGLGGVGGVVVVMRVGRGLVGWGSYIPIRVVAAPRLVLLLLLRPLLL